MHFKNLIIYSLSGWHFDAESLNTHLKKRALQPCTASELQTIGWVSPKPEHESLVYAQGKQHLICLGVEKKLLPSSVINQATALRCADIEERQGYKCGRKQTGEVKEAITLELSAKAFTTRSFIYAWIDNENNRLVIDAASFAKADLIIEMLFKTIEDKFIIAPIRTQSIPTQAMTAWLNNQEPPSSLTIDRDCELRAKGEGAETVRYVRHNLESKEINQHISDGKEVTKLAMSWCDKYSFMLDEHGHIKRLKPLDLIKDQASAEEESDVFDAEFAIMSGELKQLIPDLIESL